MKRQLTVFLVLFALLLWTIRVVNLNREKKSGTVYIEQGQEFYCGPLAMRAEEFLVLDAGEYETRFGVEGDVADADRAACVRFTVRNSSEEAVSWDDVFSAMGEGFVCRGWGSACDPFMGSKLNSFYSGQLGPGAQEEIWLVTTLSRICFREGTWEKLPDMEFEYVMSMYPEAVRIRLHRDSPAAHAASGVRTAACVREGIRKGGGR